MLSRKRADAECNDDMFRGDVAYDAKRTRIFVDVVEQD